MRRREILSTLPVVALSGCSATESLGRSGSLYEIDDFTFRFSRNTSESVVGLSRVSRDRDGTDSIRRLRNLPAESREILNEAIEKRQYATEEVPASIEAIVQNETLVECTDCDRTGRYFGFALWKGGADGGNRLNLDVTVDDWYLSMGSPATVKFRVANQGSRPITVHSGVVPPFGVLTASTETGEQNIVLWNDEYAETEEVSTEFGVVTGVAKQEVATELQPGEKRAETYQIRLRDYLPFVRTRNSPPTRFALDGTLSYSRPNRPIQRTANYAARFRISG